MRSSHTSKTFAILIVVIALGLLAHYFLRTWLGKSAAPPDRSNQVALDRPADGEYWLHYVFQKGTRTFAVAQKMKLASFQQGGSLKSATIQSLDETQLLIEVTGSIVDPAMRGLGYLAVVKDGKVELRTISEMTGTQ
jgi:hypothetical protein